MPSASETRQDPPSTFEEKQQDEIISLQIHAIAPRTGNPTYQSFGIYPGDENFLKAVFVDQAEAFVAYVTGDYAAYEGIAVLKVTYTMSLAELSNANVDERQAVRTVELANSQEEAVAWIRSAQNTYSDRYYYMPDYGETSFSRLYVYRFSEVERYQEPYNYTMPDDPVQFFYQREIPTTIIMDLIEK